MKNFFTAVALVFVTGSSINAKSSVQVQAPIIEEADHYQCKINAISVAYTAAEILGTEPSVAYFKEVYMECMGY